MAALHAMLTGNGRKTVVEADGDDAFIEPERLKTARTHLSMSESLMLVAMAEGCAVSPSLNTLSMTDSSVLVVSSPQNAHQSLTTIPAAITSLPRFTVPACTRAPRVTISTLTCYQQVPGYQQPR